MHCTSRSTSWGQQAQRTTKYNNNESMFITLKVISGRGVPQIASVPYRKVSSTRCGKSAKDQPPGP